jgi:hypothetical protein
MQAAYACFVKKLLSLRHRNRRAQLLIAIEEAGNATALAIRVGTPKSHISAMASGARGMGDALAAKIERKLGKPEGWMDRLAPAGQQDETAEISDSEWALLQNLRDIVDDGEREQLRAEVAARSERSRQMRRKVLEQAGIPNGDADKRRVAAALGHVPKPGSSVYLRRVVVRKSDDGGSEESVDDVEGSGNHDKR